LLLHHYKVKVKKFLHIHFPHNAAKIFSFKKNSAF